MIHRKTAYTHTFKFAYYVSSFIAQYLFLALLLCLESVTYHAVSQPIMILSIALLLFSILCTLYVGHVLNSLQGYSTKFGTRNIKIHDYVSASGNRELNVLVLVCLYGFEMISPAFVTFGLIIGQIVIGLIYDFYKDPNDLPFNIALILVHYRIYQNVDPSSSIDRVFVKSNTRVVPSKAIPMNPIQTGLDPKFAVDLTAQTANRNHLAQNK